MGSYSDGENRNLERRVYLDAFYLERYESTNAYCVAYVKADVCEFLYYIKSDFRVSYYGNPEFDKFPVIYIDWTMARTYCETWRGARLPTEAELEKVVRGTDGREDLTRIGDRIIRGGAWSEGPDDQRIFYRSWIGYDLSESAIGFRCAKSP